MHSRSSPQLTQDRFVRVALRTVLETTEAANARATQAIQSAEKIARRYEQFFRAGDAVRVVFEEGMPGLEEGAGAIRLLKNLSLLLDATASVRPHFELFQKEHGALLDETTSEAAARVFQWFPPFVQRLRAVAADFRKRYERDLEEDSDDITALNERWSVVDAGLSRDD